MENLKDGGSAFPVIPPVDDTGRTAVGYPYPEAGMSLRDWFAGQALVGLMSDPGMRPDTTAEFQHMAMRLYQVADAMLAARGAS